MTSTALIYLLVKVFEIAIVIFSGVAISRLPEQTASSKYWKLAIWAILAYAVGEGLRWGHMVDYNSGCITYYGIEGFWDDKRNPLWSIIIYSFKILGVRYSLFIFIQCAFVMFSIMVLMKNYYKYASFILPLAIIGILMNENFVRWFTAFGFVLIGLHYFIHKKNARALVFFGMAVLTHFGFLFIIYVFVCFKILNRLNLNPWLVCAVFIVVDLFGDISWIARPMNDLSLFLVDLGLTQDINDGFSYLSSTDLLLSGELSTGITESSIYAKIGRLIVNVPVLLFSKDCIKDEIPHYNSYYNLYAIGLILGQLFKMVSLLGRISDILVFFFCIVGGVFYSISFKKNGSIKNIVLVMGILLYFAPYILGPFSREDRDMRFLWDSDGQEYDKTYI